MHDGVVLFIGVVLFRITPSTAVVHHTIDGVKAKIPRAAWILGAMALAFGLSLVRTPTTAAVAALVFLLGSVAYAILRIRWTRRQPRPRIMPVRTADGVLYLGGAETVLGLTDRLVPVSGERGAYERPKDAALAG